MTLWPVGRLRLAKKTHAPSGGLSLPFLWLKGQFCWWRPELLHFEAPADAYYADMIIFMGFSVYFFIVSKHGFLPLMVLICFMMTSIFIQFLQITVKCDVYCSSLNADEQLLVNGHICELRKFLTLIHE